MDDILQEMKSSNIENKLVKINNLHPSLTFTMEKQTDGMIPFLDMKISNIECNLSSSYSKPTDTGLILNYHALAPRRYKKSVVSGLVHRITRACSKWQHVHEVWKKLRSFWNKTNIHQRFTTQLLSRL